MSLIFVLGNLSEIAMRVLPFLLGKTKKQSKKARAEEQPAKETVLSDVIEIVPVIKFAFYCLHVLLQLANNSTFAINLHNSIYTNFFNLGRIHD